MLGGYQGFIRGVKTFDGVVTVLKLASCKDKVKNWFIKENRQARSRDFSQYIQKRELQLRGYSPACISDISEHGEIGEIETQFIQVFPGYTEVRNIKLRARERGKGARGGGGRKGAMHEFSWRSRWGMMKKVGRLKSPLPYWQDFTFADDVMSCSDGARAIYAHETKKRFLRMCKAEGIEINALWKREWKKRISGSLIGQYVPHYHFLYNLGGKPPEFEKLARLWVKATQTNQVVSALQVALHEKSYRLINSRRQAQKYVCEYLEKDEGFYSEESIGRSWGVVGNLEFSEGEQISVKESESILLKRCFRKIYRGYRKNKNMTIRLRNKFTEFTMFVEESTIKRLIEETRLKELGEWFETETAEALS